MPPSPSIGFHPLEVDLHTSAKHGAIDGLRNGLISHFAFLTDRPQSDILVVLSHPTGIRRGNTVIDPSSNQHQVVCKVFLRSPQGAVETILCQTRCTSSGPLGTTILALATMYEKIIPLVEEKQANFENARFQIVDGKMQDTVGSKTTGDQDCLSTGDGNEVSVGA